MSLLAPAVTAPSVGAPPEPQAPPATSPTTSPPPATASLSPEPPLAPPTDSSSQPGPPSSPPPAATKPSLLRFVGKPGAAICGYLRSSLRVSQAAKPEFAELYGSLSPFIEEACESVDQRRLLSQHDVESFAMVVHDFPLPYFADDTVVDIILAAVADFPLRLPP